MKIHTHIHKIAMIWMDNAETAESNYARDQALQKALAFEIVAARNVDHPLTRAVYYRSAAAIAMQANAHAVAVSLVAEVLATDSVPRALLHELSEILHDVDLRCDGDGRRIPLSTEFVQTGPTGFITRERRLDLKGVIETAVDAFRTLAAEYGISEADAKQLAPKRAPLPPWAEVRLNDNDRGSSHPYSVYLADTPPGSRLGDDHETVEDAQAYAWLLDEAIQRPGVTL